MPLLRRRQFPGIPDDDEYHTRMASRRSAPGRIVRQRLQARDARTAREALTLRQRDLPHISSRGRNQMSLLIGVPREVFPGEKRVATVPDVVEKLIKLGFRVAIESGAGDSAQIGDDAYRAAGGEI